ncbi:MAG: phosphatase PAP2 family protein [Planctomycetota bacterium]|nr:phosphatase PAP2 family protein [Planctomycetota bacterium]
MSEQPGSPLTTPPEAEERAATAARKRAVLVVIAGVALGTVLLPLDGPVSAFLRANPPGGDLRRELNALQQYGAISSIIIALVIIGLLQPERLRAVVRVWAAAMVVGAVVINALKLLIGRPRPKFDDPLHFPGPFGAYPIDPEVGVRHAWELGSGISSDLHSMPSSHTAYAVIMSVVLTHFYPKLRPLLVVWACVVGVARVVLGAHFMSDVVVGAALGYAIASLCVRRE